MLLPKKGLLSDYYSGRNLNVWIYPISTPRRKYPGLHLLQSILFSAQLRKQEIDAVVANTFSAASRISSACKFARIPYAIYLREYIRDCPLHRRVLRRADGLFAVSKDLANHIKQMGNFRHLAVVYDNIQVDPIINRLHSYRNNGERKVPFSSSVPVVGWVGRITPYKQPDVFLKAIPLVIKSLPQVRFILVGKANRGEEGYEQDLKNFVVNNGIEQFVKFLGQRDEALELMCDCNVICMTSRREPFARVILEAQVIGVPVIAANSGGAPEVVKHDDTGILFNACNRDSHVELAEAILMVLGNSTLAKRISERARQNVFDYYASEIPAQEYERQLQALILRNKK